MLKDDSLIEGLDQINKSVQYLSETIDDFRNFYKPNKYKNEFKTIDLRNQNEIDSIYD